MKTKQNIKNNDKWKIYLTLISQHLAVCHLMNKNLKTKRNKKLNKKIAKNCFLPDKIPDIQNLVFQITEDAKLLGHRKLKIMNFS